MYEPLIELVAKIDLCVSGFLAELGNFQPRANAF
jgi:hypothetical protein